jgi:hypothetical protein
MPDTLFTVDLKRQLDFAALSGDFNPAHTDRQIARREIFGDIVVHGVHLVMFSIDYWLKNNAENKRYTLKNIRSLFQNPLLINNNFNIVTDSNKIQIRDTTGLLIQDIQFSIEHSSTEKQSCLEFANDLAADKPKEHTLDEVKNLSGEIILFFNHNLCQTLFPSLTKSIPEIQIAGLLSLTRIVGMDCPGLYSLFSSFNCNFYETYTPAPVKYKVKQVVEKYSMVNIQVVGPGMEGELKTFMRPKPKKQPSLTEVAPLIKKEEFNSINALIIGGSRGIGEITAKIIAAGGGKSVITYHHGSSDAEKISNEIQNKGYYCQFTNLDITNPDWSKIDEMNHQEMFNTVFYLASPKIFVKRGGIFNNDLFKSFSDYYVNNFYNVINHLSSITEKLIVFYPSTVAIDEKPLDLTEYIMAKVAGEELCAFVNRQLKHVQVIMDRLPRMATDQTLNFANYPACEPVEVMLPIVRNICKKLN